MAVVAASRAALGAVITVLSERGHEVIAPVVRDATLTLDRVSAEHELPTGVTLHQAPGRSRLLHGEGPQRFAWAPTPSWKRVLQPPEVDLLHIGRRVRVEGGSEPVVSSSVSRTAPLALLGVRDCDLRAIEILDRVLAVEGRSDPDWVDRRRGLFVVAVTCGVPASTCWCPTTGGGPVPERFDLRLTELDAVGSDVSGSDAPASDVSGPDAPASDVPGSDLPASDVPGSDLPGPDASDVAPDTMLLIEAGSPAGEAVLDEVAGRISASTVRAEHRELAERVAGRARSVLGTGVPRPDLVELQRHADEGVDRSPHWDDVAARCVACGNCTSVCPTCFCVSLLDDTGLAGDHPDVAPDDVVPTGVRRRTWASCFELEHSVLGGHAVRATRGSRYRQWFTHKLITWEAQFGTPGCVGCGRCSIACPVGIDLPAEAAAVAAAVESAHTSANESAATISAGAS